MFGWLEPVVELVIAFVTGGIFTTFLSEYFSRRRERKALLLDHLANLVKSYQLYVRLLRRPPETWTEESMDRTHAEFIAEIKILNFSGDFDAEADALKNIGKRLFQVRTDLEQDKQAPALHKIYVEFNEQVDAILARLKR